MSNSLMYHKLSPGGSAVGLHVGPAELEAGFFLYVKPFGSSLPVLRIYF